MSNGWQALFRVIDLALLIAFLAVPFWIVVEYPQSAQATSGMYAVLVPWIVILYIVSIFRVGIGQAFAGFSYALSRIKSAGLGSAKAEFHGQSEVVGGEPAQPNDDVARMWYVRYIASTIYGSQFAAVTEARQGPIDRMKLESYYERYIEKGGAAAYRFENWLAFMVNNLLIRRNNDGAFEITTAGESFLNAAEEVGISEDTFKY